MQRAEICLTYWHVMTSAGRRFFVRLEKAGMNLQQPMKKWRILLRRYQKYFRKQERDCQSRTPDRKKMRLP